MANSYWMDEISTDLLLCNVNFRSPKIDNEAVYGKVEARPRFYSHRARNEKCLYPPVVNYILFSDLGCLYPIFVHVFLFSNSPRKMLRKKWYLSLLLFKKKAAYTLRRIETREWGRVKRGTLVLGQIPRLWHLICFAGSNEHL